MIIRLIVLGEISRSLRKSGVICNIWTQWSWRRISNEGNMFQRQLGEMVINPVFNYGMACPGSVNIIEPLSLSRLYSNSEMHAADTALKSWYLEPNWCQGALIVHTVLMWVECCPVLCSYNTVKILFCQVLKSLVLWNIMLQKILCYSLNCPATTWLQS